MDPRARARAAGHGQRIPAEAPAGADGLVGAPVTGYDTAWGETDQAIAAFRDTIAESGETVRRAYRPALDNLSELQEVRPPVQANPAAPGRDPGFRAFSAPGLCDAVRAGHGGRDQDRA